MHLTNPNQLYENLIPCNRPVTGNSHLIMTQALCHCEVVPGQVRIDLGHLSARLSGKGP